MKQDKQKHNWLIDAALFGGFLGSLWLDLTGVAVHQWLGLAVGALAGYHLLKHWSWVQAVTGRLFGRTSQQSRIFYAVDAGLAIGFAAILGTGLAISTWFNLSLASYAAWFDVHVAVSVATLILLVAKIGFHWRWIANVARRSIFPAPALNGRPGAARPVPAAAQTTLGRRDFMRLMAGVGAVALLTGVNALSGLSAGQTEASVEGQAATSTQSVTSTSTSTTQARTTTATTTATSACTVRCNKGCSYPGRCRKYVDSNGNGKCDLGECAA